jgi:hypothetical protein
MKQKREWLCIVNIVYATSMFGLQEITAPISIGDLIDKITILQVKLEKITDPEKLQHIAHELELLSTTLTHIPQSPELNECMQQLHIINRTLWDIENAIRAKEAAQIFDTEFIELARSVYLNNGQRHAIKRTINMLTGSEIIEEKQYTKYQ